MRIVLPSRLPVNAGTLYDDFEKAHPDACPVDCQSAKEVISEEKEAKETVPMNEDSPFGFHPAIPLAS